MLLFFLMATTFMGYVLPSGHMSVWGATIITRVLCPCPLLLNGFLEDILFTIQH